MHSIDQKSIQSKSEFPLLAEDARNWAHILRKQEEMNMSNEINPEAGQPSTIHPFELGGRNPPVVHWGAEGGQIPSPSQAEIRMTPEGPAISPDAGLQY